MKSIICQSCGIQFSVPNRREHTAKYCGERCKGLSYRKPCVPGDRFGRLTAVKEIFSNNNDGPRTAVFKCDCGVEKTILITSVRNGNTTSCGCYRDHIHRTNKNRRTHGLCKHPLHGIWNTMKQRCSNKNAGGYKFYGKKGVRVCQEWQDDFKSFFDWAIKNGWRSGYDVDKDIKGNGLLYSPEMCVVVSSIVNGRYQKQFKLNEKKANEIRRLRAEFNYSTERLSSIYDVSKSLIVQVLANKLWA